MNYYKPLTKKTEGFTLIEILVVIGIIAVLAAIVLIAINPARQFAQSRNSQRTSNVNAILNAIGQNIADNAGIFTCANDLPDPGDAREDIGDDTGELDLRDCIVPDYMPEIPVDPVDGTACTDDDCDDGYSTGYTVEVTDPGNRIRVCAPSAADEDALGDDAEEICVTR